ncbi:MAG: 4Fe-4S ferredoxin [Kiritimatiellia bacterium]
MTERQSMQADIVVVGFGPSSAGFLTTLAAEVSKTNPDGTPLYESRVMPGCPLQILCYERADDTGFGVSGVVTQAKHIRASFPGRNLAEEIPNAADISSETVAYLFDKAGGPSRRTAGTKTVDAVFKGLHAFQRRIPEAAELPWIPPFLRKHGGMVLSMGQFMSWCAANLMGTGVVQIWPGTPVAEPLFEGDRVKGVRLADQGVDKRGNPDPAVYMPGMDVEAALLTVVADGPVGPVGRALDERFGLPPGHHRRDWAVGMKAVVELPESCTLEPGTVIHTLGYPEPELFGFLYVYPGRTASLGIFVPSWLDSPLRTSYRYLQHWMRHPYLWRHLKGGKLRSWGAKSLQESGMRGEPWLAGDGYARIGEGSGTTNVLTNSGVDEAWHSGVLLAEGVIELLKSGRAFRKDNLEEVYVARRRRDPMNRELKAAAKARDGFNKGFFLGMMGTGMTGMTRGLLNLPFDSVPPSQRIRTVLDYYGSRIPKPELEALIQSATTSHTTLHDKVMDRLGWEPIPFDGELLMSHQDALLKGGKVQAAGGFADHIVFDDPEVCRSCTEKTCAEICSAQAITPGENGVPDFDREKCIHCGACIWSCSRAKPENPEKANITFRAGSGGLHSNEN